MEKINTNTKNKRVSTKEKRIALLGGYNFTGTNINR